jgi:DNA-binding MarR family transcriptional regulator
VNDLAGALRAVMIQAKNRQRAMMPGDQGRVAVLFALAKEGRMRPSALAREVSLDLSTVSRHLRALEDEGRAAKSPDPDDGRAFQVGLTDRGWEFVHEFWRERVASMHRALAAWPADDVRTLTRLLEKFVSDTEGHIR